MFSANNITNKAASNLPLGPQGFQVPPGNHGGLSAIAVWNNRRLIESYSSENYPGRMLIDNAGNFIESGWYFSTFRGVCSSAAAGGRWWGMSDTMVVVYHDATEAAMNKLKHQDLVSYPTKFSVQGPMPNIPAVDYWKARAGNQNADMDCNGTVLAVSYRDHNQIRTYHPTNGSLQQTITVTSPNGVAVDSNGDLYVCTQGGVRKFTAASGYTSSSVIYTGLDTPFRIDVDNTCYYVSTLGSDHRCYVIKKSDNIAIRIDGTPGGWQDGLLNRLSYRHVVEITADGNNNGGYYAIENTAPRRLIHRTQEDSLVEEYYGPMQWAAPGAFNRHNIREIFFRWTPDQLVLMEGNASLTEWKAKAVWTFNHPMAGAGFGGGGEGDFYPFDANGYTYLRRRADRDISVLKLDRTDYSLRPCFRYSCYETSQSAFQWEDKNGNGNADSGEITPFPGTADSYQDVGIVPGGNSMDYYALRYDGFYKFPLLGYNSVGSPIYNFNNGIKFYSKNMYSFYKQITGAVCEGDTRLFVIYSQQTAEQAAIPNGGGWGMSGVNEVYCFNKTTLEFLWMRQAQTVPRTANNTTPANLAPNQVNTFKNVAIRAVGDYCIINDFEGGWDDNFPATLYVIDKDGNWISSPYNSINPNHPSHWYVEATENGSADILRNETTGKVYRLALTESFARIIEITGPSGFTTAGTGQPPPPPPAPTPLTLPAAFNAGGSAIGSFAADAHSQGGSTTSVTQAIDTTGVVGAGPMAMYQNERYGNNGAAFSYEFLMPKANQAYQVKLHFAESWVAGRKFNISNGSQSLVTDLCVAQEAGGMNRALVKTYTAKSDANKKLLLTFSQGSVDWPKVSGIEITGEAVVTPPPINPRKRYTRVYQIMVTNTNGQSAPMNVMFESRTDFNDEFNAEFT